MMKQKAMILPLLSTTNHAVENGKSESESGTHSICVECVDNVTTDENDGPNLKSMFLALLNDVRLLQSAIFFCKTFRFTSIGFVVVVVLSIWDYKYNNRFQ